MITLFYIGLLLCCFLCLYRIGRGPSAPDRTVAIDILGMCHSCSGYQEGFLPQYCSGVGAAEFHWDHCVGKVFGGQKFR